MRDCYSLDAGLEQKYRNIMPCSCGTRQAKKTKQFAKHIGKKSLCPSVRLFHHIFTSFRHETCFLTPGSLSPMKPGFLIDDNAFALTFSYCHIVAQAKLPEPTWWIKSNAHNNSWIKRGQLDVTCFFISLFNAQHVSDVNTSKTCW